MVIQFGYVAMFGWCWPLGGVVALLNNLVEIRSDCYKFLKSFQRPMTPPVWSIEPWDKVMSCISVLSVLTTFGMIGVDTFFLEDEDDNENGFFYDKWSPVAKVLLIVGGEHLLLLVKTVIDYIIPQQPWPLRVSIARKEYERHLHNTSSSTALTGGVLHAMSPIVRKTSPFLSPHNSKSDHPGTSGSSGLRQRKSRTSSAKSDSKKQQSSAAESMGALELIPASEHRKRNKELSTSISSQMEREDGFCGTLTLVIHKARRLNDMDPLSDQDPYLRVSVGEAVYETRVHRKGGLEPVWEETVTFELEGHEKLVKMWCMDRDIGEDDKIASEYFLIGDVVRFSGQSKWFPLTLHSRFGGEVLITVTFEGNRIPTKVEEDESMDSIAGTHEEKKQVVKPANSHHHHHHHHHGHHPSGAASPNGTAEARDHHKQNNGTGKATNNSAQSKPTLSPHSPRVREKGGLHHVEEEILDEPEHSVWSYSINVRLCLFFSCCFPSSMSHSSLHYLSIMSRLLSFFL